MKTISIVIFLLFIFGCKDQSDAPLQALPESGQNSYLELSYAKGFSILKQDDFDVLEVKKPWPKAEKAYKYALIPKEKAAVLTLNKDEFDGMIITPIKRIVVTSTTHIPSLELLEMEGKLVGFPGTDYISSKKTRALIDNKSVRELGRNEDINTEVLIDLQPDAVIAFGVDGTSRSFDIIKTSNIPVIYNGDWTEDSPLAKAEWIKFFGALFDKELEADSIFKTIETNYLQTKSAAQNINVKPTVLSGAMHKDVWYLPNGNSSEATLLRDAGLDYLWKESKGTGSLALSYEAVFEKAQNADLWINPSYYTTKESLTDASELYTNFKAFKTDQLYTFATQKGATGGVLYYELGLARPDLVLMDLIKIAHPEQLPDYTMTFFSKMD